jgi:cystathionine beta-lyase family protein involved in aluminum resistance
MVTAGQKLRWSHQMQIEEELDEISDSLENTFKSLKQYHYLNEEIVFRRFHKNAVSDHQLCRICQSIHMEQLCFQWTDFHEI